MLKKTTIILLAIFMLVSAIPSSANADEIPVVNILKNSLYGGVIGGLLGTATLAFADTPSEHNDFISKGAAIGVFTGAVFGFYQMKDYLVKIDGNGITMSLPVVKLDMVTGTDSPAYQVGLLKLDF